jgi:hypothetical protein
MGEEFANALSLLAGDADISGVDAYTVIIRIFSAPLTPEALAHANGEQIERLRQSFATYLEIADDAVTTEHITQAISRTLTRWPPEAR